MSANAALLDSSARLEENANYQFRQPIEAHGLASHRVMERERETSYKARDQFNSLGHKILRHQWESHRDTANGSKAAASGSSFKNDQSFLIPFQVKARNGPVCAVH